MRRVLTGLLAAALLPTAAAAQTIRAWELCFTSGVLSCTELWLTTTPQLVGGTRTGTLFDVVLRYVEHDARPSALQDVAFVFAPAPSDADVVGPATLFAFDALGGAPAAGAGWAQRASSSPGDPAASHLVLTSHADLFGFPPATPQYVAGCGAVATGGQLDALTHTPLWTCGAGAAYRASFASSATLDADRVTAISVDIYRAADASTLPAAPFCTAQTDGSGSIGTAEGDFSDFGDVCAVRALDVTPVPEPATTALVAGGLLLLSLARRRHPATRRLP